MEINETFSAGRRWAVRLNVMLGVCSALAVALMVNYLAARYFVRTPLARAAQAPLSPLSKRVLGMITNQINVTVLFDKDDPVYEPVLALLKEYKYVNDKIVVKTVDYIRQPGEAQLVKTLYKLSQGPDKDLVIFEGNGRTRIITSGELSEIDVQPLLTGQSKEARRTHFKGEVMFTSALLTVTSGRPLKACFLQGHGEHRPDDDNKVVGYSRFAGLLQENNIRWEPLSLVGSAEIPADCHVLIIAGPKDPFLAEELDKIEAYLKQGGRMLVMFNHDSAPRQLGLEKTLANWGVAVGHDVVIDPKYSSPGQLGKDLAVSTFSDHPIMSPMYQSKSTLYLLLPRSVSKAQSGSADSPQVKVLAMSSPEARVATDIRDGAAYPRDDDYVGTVPLMVAVEKGSIKGVSADRGATRMVVAGESFFLGNQTLDMLGNREFAMHAVNWLLARNELLVGVAPRPITEYKLTMTASQLSTTRWILMAGLPGSVLLGGMIVAVRRRK
jgi:hypothetical protein